ncbi:MAG TPA: hypothetical protein VK446_09465 [Methylocystis sp.]|nr:hypothetical protein [Methylocystis sp.]
MFIARSVLEVASGTLGQRDCSRESKARSGKISASESLARQSQIYQQEKGSVNPAACSEAALCRATFAR